MKGMKKACVVLAASVLLCATPSLVLAQESGKPADNTKVNKRDRHKGAVTADQQKENQTDRELSANIRKALMDDKSLSTYAHNIKVVARGGVVTLKGPVRSEQEKDAIAAKATELAGAGKVRNEISVRPKS